MHYTKFQEQRLTHLAEKEQFLSILATFPVAYKILFISH